MCICACAVGEGKETRRKRNKEEKKQNTKKRKEILVGVLEEDTHRNAVLSLACLLTSDANGTEENLLFRSFERSWTRF